MAAESNVKAEPETFIRAETDRMFYGTARQAGGVNKLCHFRTPTPLDKQTVIRMNLDTLYSMGVVDTVGGATITVPEMPKDRYFSVYLVDNDHYVPEVIYGSGTHKLPADTKYLGVGVRIQLLKADDPEELALINKLQDQFVIKAHSADPFPAPKWDKASLDALRAEYEREFQSYAQYESDWQGPAARSMKRRGTSRPPAPGDCFPSGTPSTSTTVAATTTRSASAQPIRSPRTTLSGRSPSTARTVT